MMLKGLLKTALGFMAALCLLPTNVVSFAKVNIPKELENIYELSPQAVRQTFESEGWDLECADGRELNRIYGYGDFSDAGYEIAGITIYEIKTIYLSDTFRYAETSLNHEIGHYLDYSYYTYYGIQPSRTDEFYDIFRSEAAPSYMYETYELSDIGEYFAQSYREYVQNRDALEMFYPRTCRYISNIVEDYEAAVENNFKHTYDDVVFMMAAKQK